LGTTYPWEGGGVVKVFGDAEITTAPMSRGKKIPFAKEMSCVPFNAYRLLGGE